MRKLLVCGSLLLGLQGCETGEDDACHTDLQCNGDRICEEGICMSPEDVGDGDGDGDGFGDGDGDGDGDSAPIADQVVGAWYTEGTAEIEGESVAVKIGWSLCADRRIYGFTEINGYAFIDKGNYSVSESSASVSASYSSKDTSIGDIWGPDSATLNYSQSSDTLTFSDCCFGATLQRLEGTVDNSDCDPAW